MHSVNICGKINSKRENMRQVLLGANYFMIIVFLAYKHYEYPFSGVLGKNSLKKLAVWDVLRNFASIS